MTIAAGPMRTSGAERFAAGRAMPADVTGVALTTQLVCWRPKGRRHRAGQRCFARGNLVRIRDCPAAVCRNDRRLGSRQALVSTTGKRRPVGAPTGCEPASPKTCQPCRTRRARRLIASWNGRLAVPVAGCIGVHLNRIGCASAGGEPPVDRRTARDPACTSSTLYRNHHRLPAHRPAPQLKRATEGYWAGRTSRSELEAVAATLRRDTWSALAAAGLDSVPVNTFSYYDQMLDTAVLLGALPPRVSPVSDGLDRYFAAARAPTRSRRWR